MTRAEYVQKTVLEAGVWQFGEYTFASGKRANNKFEMPLALEKPISRHVLLAAMELLAVKHQPDALFGVPAGGQRLAKIMGQEMDLPVIHLEKIAGRTDRKDFFYHSVEDHVLALKAQRIVGVEDVTNEFTSTIGALRLPELSKKTVAIIAGWCRGKKTTDGLRVPVEGAIEAEVPNVIMPDHYFYRRYGHFAIESPDFLGEDE